MKSNHQDWSEVELTEKIARLRRAADAGGKVPYSLRKLKTKPGCTPLLVE